MSPRTALYLPGLRPGSVSWTIYQDFATAVRALGLEFEVWTDRPDSRVDDVPGTRFLEVRSAAGLDRLLAPLTRSPRLARTVRTVAPHLRGPRAPDLLYVEMLYPHGVAVDLARRVARSGIRLVIKPTGEDVLSVPDAAYGYPRFRVPRWLVRRTLARAEGVRCISPLVVDAVRDFTRAPCPVIPSGVSSETVAAARRSEPEMLTDRLARRRRLNAEVPEDAPLLVVLGRLHPFKGLDLAIEALRDIPLAHLLIVGPSLQIRGLGDYGDWLLRHAEQHGVADRVTQVGAVLHDRVLDVLGAADAVLVPSLLESMNKVTIEAVAAGTPVVVTRTTGISTFVDEPGVAQIIEPRSSQAIAEAACRVLDGQWRRSHDNARRFVERFAPETVARETVELFREAMRR